MRVIECSMCRRRAAWLIDRELFCEGHKEVIVQEAGVDHFRFGGSRMRIARSAPAGAFHGPKPERREKTKRMLKVFPIHSEPLICSIPLKLAVYCENCETISNSRPHRCGVCDSEAVLRVEPILNRDPDPPAHAAHRLKLFLVRAVGA